MDYEFLYLKKLEQTLDGDPDSSWQHTETTIDGTLLQIREEVGALFLEITQVM